MSFRDPKWIAVAVTIVLAVGAGTFYLGQRDALGDVVRSMDEKIDTMQSDVETRFDKIADILTAQQIQDAEQSKDIQALVTAMSLHSDYTRHTIKEQKQAAAELVELRTIVKMLAAEHARTRGSP